MKTKKLVSVLATAAMLGSYAVSVQAADYITSCMPETNYPLPNMGTEVKVELSADMVTGAEASVTDGVLTANAVANQLSKISIPFSGVAAGEKWYKVSYEVLADENATSKGATGYYSYAQNAGSVYFGEIAAHAGYYNGKGDAKLEGAGTIVGTKLLDFRPNVNGSIIKGVVPFTENFDCTTEWMKVDTYYDLTGDYVKVYLVANSKTFGPAITNIPVTAETVPAKITWDTSATEAMSGKMYLRNVSITPVKHAKTDYTTPFPKATIDFPQMAETTVALKSTMISNADGTVTGGVLAANATAGVTSTLIVPFDVEPGQDWYSVSYSIKADEDAKGKNVVPMYSFTQFCGSVKFGETAMNEGYYNSPKDYAYNGTEYSGNLFFDYRPKIAGSAKKIADLPYDAPIDVVNEWMKVTSYYDMTGDTIQLYLVANGNTYGPIDTQVAVTDDAKPTSIYWTTEASSCEGITYFKDITVGSYKAEPTYKYQLADYGTIEKNSAKVGAFYSLLVNKVNDSLTLGVEGKDFTITGLGAFDVSTTLTYAILGNIGAPTEDITVKSGETVYAK